VHGVTAGIEKFFKCSNIKSKVFKPLCHCAFVPLSLSSPRW